LLFSSRILTVIHPQGQKTNAKPLAQQQIALFNHHCYIHIRGYYQPDINFIIRQCHKGFTLRGSAIFAATILAFLTSRLTQKA
jgi:hypothetical protein